MKESLQQTLRDLRLSGLAASLEVRLTEAAGNRLNHLEFLELILQDELLVRSQRQIGRRVKAAGFREHKPLDEFDFSFNSSIKRKQVFNLAAGHSSANGEMCCFWDRRGWARAIWRRRSATKPSRPASRCSIAPSLTWYATSSMSRWWDRTRRPSTDI